MTTQQPIPDVLVLLRYLDGDLDPSEARAIEQQAGTTPDIQRQLKRLQRFTAALKAGIGDASLAPFSPAASPDQCPTLEDIIGYAANAVSGARKTRMESHLRSCDACLHDVIQHRAVDDIVLSGETVPLPASLRVQTESASQPAKTPLSRIVIQQVKEGLALLVEYVTAPLTAIEQLQPQLALRGESSVLLFQVNAERATVAGSAVLPSGGELSLTLQFHDKQQHPLVQKSIAVRRQGRTVFEGETDEQGAVDLSDIELLGGTYEIECPEIQTAWQFDIRPLTKAA